MESEAMRRGFTTCRMGLIVVGLLAIAPVRAERPGFSAVVGRVSGLTVLVSSHPGAESTREGAILPLLAHRDDHAGRLLLQTLAPARGDFTASFDEGARWLTGAGQTALPDLAAALGRCGVTLVPDTRYLLAGSSASLAMTVAVTSALLDVPVRQNVAVTGTLSGDGHVLSIAGVPDKLHAALVGRLDTFVAPDRNAREAFDTLGPEGFGRVRVVGVATAQEALLEAFGAQGPWADAFRARLDLLDRGLTLLADDHPAQAHVLLDDYARQVPGDCTVRPWLAASEAGASEAGAHAPRLPRAAALRWACRYDEAIEVARSVEPDERDADIVARFVAQCRRDQAADQREALLADFRAKLAAGDLEAAGALLGDAAKTRDREPEDGGAIAAAQDDLNLAAMRRDIPDRGDDPQLWLGIAACAERREQWREAADALDHAIALDVPDGGLRYRAARCLICLGRGDEARRVLLDNLLIWPGHDASRGLLGLLGHGVEAMPPSLAFPYTVPADGHLLVQAGTDQRAVKVSLRLDDRELAHDSGRLAVVWDGSAAAAGVHLLSAVTTDALGNVGQAVRPVWVGRPRPTFESPPADGAPAGDFDVHIPLAGTWLVAPHQRLVLHADRIFGPLLAATDHTPGDLRVAVPGYRARHADEPLRVHVEPAAGATRLNLPLAGQLTDDHGVAPETIRLRLTSAAPARLAVRVDGDTLRASAQPPADFQPILAALVVDGNVGPWVAPDELAQPVNALAAGEHELAAVLMTADLAGCQTAPVGVRVKP
jgi:hypothetical protein